MGQTVFETKRKGRKILIKEFYGDSFFSMLPVCSMDFDYHNGYIEIGESEKGFYPDWICDEEITLECEFDGVLYIGFATCHTYKTPESRTLEAVKKKCFEIADELGEKGDCND